MALCKNVIGGIQLVDFLARLPELLEILGVESPAYASPSASHAGPLHPRQLTMAQPPAEERYAGIGPALSLHTPFYPEVFLSSASNT